MKLTLLLLALSLTPLATHANDIGPSQPPAAELARMAPPMPPQPPDTNPHAPQSAEDRRRVDFAVAEIRAYYGTGVELRHPHIIPWSFQSFLQNRQTVPVPPTDPNVIVEAQAKGAPASVAAPAPGAMAVGPALQPDEYMVHVYARFPGDPAWYHLDVILTEDAAGNPLRRRFFRIPMPPAHGRLPPGVVC
ncbi:MAG TPA: hypothetical protein VJR29_10330 [bacterium]|nr:hypothetical protein [bacterium]